MTAWRHQDGGSQMGIWSWKRQDTPAQPPGGVGSECEAFLHGIYVEYLESTKSIIPSWAWLNVLAHGTEEQITSLATGTASQYESAARGTEWHSVVSLLAVEMLVLAKGTGRSVSEIQHSILVDVELALAREGDKRWLGPREVVGRTMAAFHGHPSDRC